MTSLFTAISSFGTVVAGVALLLTYMQFRRLDKSIKGNTYQLLADQIIQILKLLLEYPHLMYLDLTNPKTSRSDREQAIFDRLLANYLDNAWGQIKLGLLDTEIAEANRNFIAMVVKANPRIASQMMQPNFEKSLRDYVAKLVEPTTADASDVRGHRVE